MQPGWSRATLAARHAARLPAEGRWFFSWQNGYIAKSLGEGGIAAEEYGFSASVISQPSSRLTVPGTRSESAEPGQGVSLFKVYWTTAATAGYGTLDLEPLSLQDNYALTIGAPSSLPSDISLN